MTAGRGISAFMSILVTGSSGHLGEALMRTLREAGRAAVGLDIVPGPFTDCVGSIADRDCAARCMAGVETVLHAATLHKPHVATHAREAFVETNVLGTLILLEEAVRAGVGSFVMTSTTSAFGDALKTPPGEPAAWVDESVAPVPKNIYGVSKTAAEDLCRLFWRNEGLACVVLRTSRFFPEVDDDAEARGAFADDNLKANEFLYRRVAIEDVVEAHSSGGGPPALARVRKVHHQRNDPVQARGCGAPARRRSRRGARARHRLGRRICAAQLADDAKRRSGLRQRTRAARTRLAASMGLRVGDRAAQGDGRHPRPARQADRREGLSPPPFRHGSLSGRALEERDR